MMESKAKLINATIDIQSHRKLLTFAVDYCSDEEANRLLSCDSVALTAKRWTEKRSLSANAYFHVLVGKIADALTISKARAKNDMITKYGQVWYTVEDKPAAIKTTISIEEAQELEEPHLKFKRYQEDDDTYFYIMYRGSHTYNSEEMSRLIDGTVAEAKDLGIETLSPREIAKMKERWT